MNSRNRIATFARAFALFALVALFAGAAFPSASYAASAPAGGTQTASPAAPGIVTIYAIDLSNGKPIAGATVVFRSATANRIIAKGLTNESGAFKVEVPAGVYAVDVVADHYKPASAFASAVAGASSQYKVGLNRENLTSNPPPATFDAN